MVPTVKDFTDVLGYRFELAMTLPKDTAANEAMYWYGLVRGIPQGSDFVFPPTIIGKTLWKTDNKSTTTTKVSKKFVSTEFVNPEKPLLSEIVAALNSGTVALGTGWDEATDTDAVASAGGFIAINGAAAGTDAEFELGGDACEVLGLGPMNDGITVKQVNGTGINITFPAYFAGKYTAQWAYTRNPQVTIQALTADTNVVTGGVALAGFASAAPTWTWTPSTRVLAIVFDGTAAKGRISVKI